MEKEQIKLSIIVPVYNVEKYLRDCLDSLINQTYKNIEIILVDDGSTDSSGRICDEYSQKDKRIKVLHKENGGVVSARKAGIRIVTGEYTTYVDADDWIDDNAYEELIKLVIEYHPDIIAYDFIKEYVGFNIERKQPLREGLYDKGQFYIEFQKCIRENMFFCSGIHLTSWSKLFKTELLRKFQLTLDEEICFGDDLATILPCVLNMKNIYIVKQSFYHYRVRDNSITKSRETNEYYRYLKLVKSLNDSINHFGVEGINVYRYLVYVLYYYLIICVPQYCFKEERQFLLFPEIKKSDCIIIYGKGVFADGIKRYIVQKNICTIVDTLDRNDVARIKSIPTDLYTYIIIAITDYMAVRSSRLLLEEMGIDRRKILNIQKDNLLVENLPIEVRTILTYE